MTFQPTVEQTLILETVRASQENLQVVARAGAAKTTTLCLIAEAVAPLSCLCLAFNKKIAVELQTRLPESATAQTLHSLGNKAIKDFLGKWPKIDQKKAYFLLKAEIEMLDPQDRDEAFPEMAVILKMISHAKNEGYLPAGVNKLAKPLCDEGHLRASFEDEPSDLQFFLVREVIRKSFLRGMEGIIDFDDMIYLPALLPVSFPSYPLTMVDEAQDLSILNHVILKKLVKNKRLIAVGDPCQAIYAFRGAHESSMKELKETFSMKELFLTVCFRSSEAVVKNARWRAPDMQWGPTPPEGHVEVLEKWGPGLLQPGDAIICRNNAPLFRLALELLRNDMHPEMFSGDIVGDLTKIMKKLGKPVLSSAEASSALAEWRDAQEKKTRSAAALKDKYECVLLFLERAPTLGAAIVLLDNIASLVGTIKLMTGHKSKGLEFHRVFFLDQHLCKKEGQDRNVKYVIETRAKNDLFYVTSETFGAV